MSEGSGRERVTDEALMLAFRGGSSEAFEEVFRRYRPAIHGFFRRRVARAEVAEELAQETFLAVYRARERYEARATFRTYLYAVALGILRAQRRKAMFRAAFFGEAKKQEPGERAGTEESVWVREAMRKLGRMEREILMLREYEELSYAEIAEVLRLPVNTVRSRLFRARMALRELLEPGKERAGAAAGELAKRGERA